MEEKIFISLIEKYMTGKATAKEQSLLHEYYLRLTRKESLKLLENESRLLESEILNELKSRILYNESSVSKKSIFKIWHYAAAAVIGVIIIGLSFFKIEAINDAKIISKLTLKGQRTSFQLGDSTSVVLNSVSKLSYPVKFDKSKRIVELDGEAFFHVKRDENRPFIIKTGSIDIQVLGTSFNVSTYQNENKIQVALVSGSVMVKTSDNNIVALRPNEKLVYDKSNHKWEIHNFKLDEVTDWQQGILSFDNTPIEEIVKILERDFNVSIKIKGEANKNLSYTGKFNSTDINKIIEGLCFIWDAKYSIKQNNITINFSK